MLAVLGFVTVIVLLALVMSKKTSPTVALIVVPLCTGLVAAIILGVQSGDIWTSIKALSGYITGSDGIGSVAATGVMFIFSILFFGVLTDAGTFRPIIGAVIKAVGTDPIKIAIGTAALAMVVHLDGSGAVTFLICVPALAPLYDAVGMKRTTLACIVAMAAGVMNIMPWGGPTIRAATAMQVDVMELFEPMIIPVLVGIVSVFAIAVLLAKAEKKNLKNTETVKEYKMELTDEEKQLARPQNFKINVLLIILAVLALLKSGFAPAVIFMVFFCLAMIINYPDVKEQQKRVDAHAQSALMMASVLFAAGCFTGIMKGTGMIGAMAETLCAVIPESLGKYFPAITGIISMPASLLFDPDSFYYGVLPILASTAANFGISGISVARAAILGQMTTGFPISPLTSASFLLTGLAGIDFGEHQKKTIPFAFLLTIIMLAVALVIGAIEL